MSNERKTSVKKTYNQLKHVPQMENDEGKIKNHLGFLTAAIDRKILARSFFFFSLSRSLIFSFPYTSIFRRRMKSE